MSTRMNSEIVMRTASMARSRGLKAIGWCQSKVDVRFQIRELAVAVVRIDGRDCAHARCVRVVQRGAQEARQRVIDTEVPDSREALAAVTGTTGVSERARLKRSSALIPQVRGAGEPESVQLAAKRELRDGTQVERAVEVLIVHHVVER